MKIFVEYLFLPQFRILGLIILIFGVPGTYVLQLPWYLTILFWVIIAVLGLFLLMGATEVAIDPDNKHYQVALSLLGIIRFGKRIPYDQIEKIYIKRSNISQRMWMGPIQSTVRNVVFDAYIKFSDNKKVYIGSGKDKRAFRNHIQQYGNRLEAEVIDYSGT